MRKFFLFLLAAIVLTACDNLKKKDKTDSEDDTEETTKKKKKTLNEDEPTDEDDDTKKKKVSDEDENTDGWSNADRKKFLSTCVPDAEEKAGEERAKVYCNCFLKKAEQRYSSYSEADQKMDKTEVDEIAAGCNN